ncbi:MAG: FlgO family outer membrane protein [Bacteroidota bacterium]
MPEKTDKPLNFWQEMKRRKVVRALITYAAAAYVILELTSIVTDPLGLPGWTLKLVIILLSAGFVITALLSWVYDIYPDGIKKTDKIKKSDKNEKHHISKQKLSLSNVVITILMVAVVFLAYPKIFNGDKLSRLRDKNGNITLAVMPFINRSNDSSLNMFEIGLQDMLITDLTNSEDLTVNQIETMNELFSAKNKNYSSITTPLARDYANSLEARVFTQGSIHATRNNIQVTLRLINTRTGKILTSFQAHGKDIEDIWNIEDSLYISIHNFLSIKSFEGNLESYSFAPLTTKNAEAFRLYVEALQNATNLNWKASLEKSSEAIKIDSGFAGAYILQAGALRAFGEYDKSDEVIEMGYRLIDKLPLKDQLNMKAVWYIHQKQPLKSIEAFTQMLELDPQGKWIYWNIGNLYLQLKKYREALDPLKEYIRLDRKRGVSGKWVAPYFNLAEAYHELGKHRQEKKIYRKILEIVPEKNDVYKKWAICDYSRNDTVEAKEKMDMYISFLKKNGRTEASTRIQTGLIYKESGKYNKAIKEFRKLLKEAPHQDIVKMNIGQILIENEIDLQEGISYIDQLLESYPENSDLLYLKALGLYKQGEYNDAYDLVKYSWEIRHNYYHDHYLLLKEIESLSARN